MMGSYVVGVNGADRREPDGSWRGGTTTIAKNMLKKARRDFISGE